MKHIRKFNEASILKTNNIHVLPTNKPSRLIKQTNGKLRLSDIVFRGQVASGVTQNIYITSDEEIKEGDWVITPTNDIIQWAKVFQPIGKKIILTTDAYLIKDGVQAIDDEFLEWFVKNPSCEWVEVKKESHIEIEEVSYEGDFQNVEYINYKIIIPKEEVKIKDTMKHIRKFNEANIERETLEEAAERLAKHFNIDFIAGAQWQQERSYSEDEVLEILDHHTSYLETFIYQYIDRQDMEVNEEWFEQFKKK